MTGYFIGYYTVVPLMIKKDFDRLNASTGRGGEAGVGGKPKAELLDSNNSAVLSVCDMN